MAPAYFIQAGTSTRYVNVSNCKTYIIVTVITFSVLIVSFRQIPRPFELYTVHSAQKCSFNLPILGTSPISPENRFGVSLELIQAFKYRLTHTIRNEQAVRSKWEVEWHTEEQSREAQKYLFEVISNKEILQQATSRSEIRPIPAQWKHLMQRLLNKKVFHDFIEISHG